jgi:serine/threonine-protein kinase
MHDGTRRLAGRYELAEIIGRGGMGTVYRATDLVLDRTVAVKMLPADVAQEDSRRVARFQREARAAASLANPRVVAIYDTGEDESARFIVMECVSGRSLAEVLREEAPLAPARAARIAAQIADALASAHAAGIVHRDIKPGNVMLGPDDAVKVLDFGIARSMDGGALTQSTSVLGTTAYIAPEQALGEHADERSDIYSLGCLLYALLTARPPFTADAPAAVLHQHLNSDPRPPSALNPRVSPALDGVVLGMLAKAPGARPQAAGALRDRLNAAASAPTRAARARTPRTAPAPRGEPTGSTRVLHGGRHSRPGRRSAVAAAFVLVAALIIAIVALASGGGPRPAASGKRRLATAATRTPVSAARTTHPHAKAPSRATVPAQTTTSAPASPPPQATVAGAASALRALLVQNVQSGAIDPHAAQQLASALADALGAYEAGKPLDAERRLTELTTRLTSAEERGQIAPSPASQLGSGLAALRSAMLAAAPQGSSAQAQGAAPETESASPGHDAEGPAGATKHHGDGHGAGAGD